MQSRPYRVEKRPRLAGQLYRRPRSLQVPSSASENIDFPERGMQSHPHLTSLHSVTHRPSLAVASAAMQLGSRVVQRRLGMLLRERHRRVTRHMLEPACQQAAGGQPRRMTTQMSDGPS